MNRKEYLLASGWRRCGSFAGGGDCWIDPTTVKAGKPLMYHQAVAEEVAERTQLDRDVAVQDYVSSHVARLTHANKIGPSRIAATWLRIVAEAQLNDAIKAAESEAATTAAAVRHLREMSAVDYARTVGLTGVMLCNAPSDVIDFLRLPREGEGKFSVVGESGNIGCWLTIKYGGAKWSGVPDPWSDPV